LENFIITTETVAPRKWRCNICKAKCYDIVVDKYLLEIIEKINTEKIKNITDVKFDEKGDYILEPNVVNGDNCDDDDDDDDYDDDESVY